MDPTQAPTRLAAVELLELPLECVFWDERDEPRAVRAGIGGRRILVDANPAARRARIRPPCTESEARARCPQLQVQDRRPEREATQLRGAAELLTAFGPHVELMEPHRLLVEFGRSRTVLRGASDADIAEAMVQRLHKAGHRAAVVVASRPELATTCLGIWSDRLRAAPSKSSTWVLDPGEEWSIFERLPLETLVWVSPSQDPEGHRLARMEEALAHFRWLGLRTVGELAALEGKDLPSRLAEVGYELLQKARGGKERPLRAFRPPEQFMEHFELDHGTEQLEPLLFILRRLVHRLALRLDARGRSTGRLALTISHEPSTDQPVSSQPRARSRQELTMYRRFARATRDARWMFDILREGLTLPGFVRAVTLHALDVEADGGAQLDLFTRHAHRLEAAAELVTRLQSRLGPRAVCAPELVNTHRPEQAWKPVPFQLRQALREPSVQRTELPRLHVLDGARGPVPSLPVVDGQLSVTGAGAEGSGSRPVRKSRQTWPKPVPRRAEDEPPPPLPPRPCRLGRPQPVRKLSPGPDGRDRFVWREQVCEVVFWGEEERFDTEWWTRQPLLRCYRTARLTDGRCLWTFEEPDGKLYVHGLFD